MGDSPPEEFVGDVWYERRCGLDKLQTVIHAANLEDDSLGCRL
jgi:hypothetical protein